MHLASAITLSGIALSGVPIISVSTRVDASSRLSMSELSLSADHVIPANNSKLEPSTTRHLGNFVIFVIRRPLPCSKRAVVYSHAREINFRGVGVPSGSSCKVIRGKLQD